MPPELDIYVLSPHRDIETLNHFIDLYVDRKQSWDRGDEELSFQDSLTDEENGEWEPAISLDHIIKRGLDYPRRSFTVYLISCHKMLDRIILCFTEDDKVVFGLAIDDEGMQPDNLERAKRLLVQLYREFCGSIGIIVTEHYPPSSEAEFSDIIALKPHDWPLEWSYSE